MENRLTSRNESGDLLLCGNMVYGNNQDVYNAISTLEEYEDHGTPAHYAELVKAEQERKSAEYVVDAIGSEAKNIIDLLKAQSEGRVAKCTCGECEYLNECQAGLAYGDNHSCHEAQPRERRDEE